MKTEGALAATLRLSQPGGGIVDVASRQVAALFEAARLFRCEAAAESHRKISSASVGTWQQPR
jgi:hypothetical protein